MTKVLPALVAVLALAVGSLHLSLDFVLFRGNLFGFPGSRGPGGPFGLGLPQLFLANFVVFLLLTIVFLGLSRAPAIARAGVDLLLILVAVATLVAWNNFGRPNPNGLGMLALILELALIVVAAVHALTLRRA